MVNDNNNITLKNANTLLVIKLDGIGDFVLVTAFLRELRKNAPMAKIILVARNSVVDLAAECPYVNEVLVFDPWKPSLIQKLALKTKCFLFSMRYLYWKNIDLAIIPRWDIDYYGAVYLAKYSGAKRRVGFSELVCSKKAKRNIGYDDYLTDAIPDSGIIHETDRSLHLLKVLRGKIESFTLELWISPRSLTIAQHFLNPWLCNPLIGLGIGAKGENRQWPWIRYAEVAEILYNELGAVSILLGSNMDKHIAKKIENYVNCSIVNLVGKTSLQVLSATISHCNLVIGNDSGIIHIATSVNRPVIIISPHTRNASSICTATPERFGPRGVVYAYIQPEKALPPCQNACKASYTHCINTINTEDVINNVKKLWSTIIKS